MVAGDRRISTLKSKLYIPHNRMLSEFANLINSLSDLPEAIKAFGLIGVWTIVLLETGVFFGVFLPGNSMLFTAGVLAQQGLFDLGALTMGAFVCAVLGNNIGYSTGYRFGRRLFRREDSLIFHKKHLVAAQLFYEKHGRNTIVMARFLPIIRTFGAIVAGIGSMNYRTFLVYNTVGGAIWAFGIPLLGYYLGALIGDDIDRYLLPIILVMITVSCTTSLVQIYREHKASKTNRL